jgi:RNA polymerase sigma-70 factor, ECF subfamily
VAKAPSVESAADARADADDLVERLREDVARAVRNVCPDWLVDAADDLTQIATARVLDRIRATAGTVTFSAGYVYRAAYSVLIDEIRKRRRLREVPIASDLVVPSGGADPERQATGRAIREAIADCLSRVILSRRRAVMLYLQGHSFAEIADLLSCAKKKAENLVYRGLADVRACLTAKGIAP